MGDAVEIRHHLGLGKFEEFVPRKFKGIFHLPVDPQPKILKPQGWYRPDVVGDKFFYPFLPRRKLPLHGP